MAEQVEKRFMEWMLRDNACPGTAINELELARQFGVATTGIREFLNRFQRFGLIEKRPNAGWVFKGFTARFALELFEIREMFEVRSAKAFAALPETLLFGSNSRRSARNISLCWANSIQRFHDFSDLDSRFHRLITSASPNRFIDSFYDTITLDLPLSLSVEQAGRTTTQRDRHSGASDVHRSTAQARYFRRRTCVSSAFGFSQSDPHSINVWA